MQLWVPRQLRAQLIEARPVSERLLCVVLRIARRISIWIAAHAPDGGGDDAENFFRLLTQHVEELKAKHVNAPITVLADFNARVGAGSSRWIGPHEPVDDNGNGTVLRYFLEKSNRKQHICKLCN